MLPERIWQTPQEQPIPADLQNALDGPPFLARALFQRGITTPAQVQAFLDPQVYQPASPAQLPDLEKAADRLLAAIRASETIGVWGDFDVDGQTATTLLVSALRQAGGKVQYYIPVRERESHGIQLQALKRFLSQGIDLLLTCDTGVSAHDAVEYAQASGVPVIITDHHALPPTLPGAFAVVNPQRLPADHPLQPLCGVGTAFKLVEALYDLIGQKQASQGFIDLAALGTVADVASLIADNRWLVQMGLRQIRQNPRPALKQLCADSNINIQHFNEEHINFSIAPLLNAIGRLADANPMVDFLNADDPQLISVRSAELRGLNEKRKLQCDQVFTAALAQIEREPSLLDGPVLILHHPAWPGGVVGIVASRLVERYNRLVILLTGEDLLRGSGRSIEGVNLIQAISAQSALLKSFGGHPMAAGLSLEKENLPAFRRAINEFVLQSVALPLPPPTLSIDAFLKIPDINLDLAAQIDRLSPFGAGNPALQFALANVKLLSHRKLGSGGDHIEAVVEDSDQNTLRVIWWQAGSYSLPRGRFDLAFTLHASDYRGAREIQAEWKHARPLKTETIEVQAPLAAVEWLDFRQDAEPIKSLQSLLAADSGWVVWKEGMQSPPPSGYFRHQLSPAAGLIVWNIPTSWETFNQAMNTVSPQKVALFANPSSPDTLEKYLKTLLRLIRYLVNHQNGQATVEELSAASGQPASMVRLALDYLSARGLVQFLQKEYDRYVLAMQPDFARVELYDLQQRLQDLYNEVKAYQATYLNLPINLFGSIQ
ncbi:MAG: single-stranded-DNA-specific exonuclease RecJ [Chloroflexi bacterium]|nr:single-stranded-DNA-specific exonuclease RecJ [Chloroflexota bacterium]